MSEFAVQVVRLGSIMSHPNADTLSITLVHGGYPCIIRNGEFDEGDLAVYLPVDAVLPNVERWAWLKGHLRIRAKRLRGMFSMGLLVAADPLWAEGQDVREELGVTKWEPRLDLLMRTENEHAPDLDDTIYTDIEGLRRWGNVLNEGEAVSVTEKIHGANGRFCWHDGRLWVGSHRRWKLRDKRNLWWRAAFQADLERRLSLMPDVVFYGEVFGQVQDLKYDRDLDLAFFDSMLLPTRRYDDVDVFMLRCSKIRLTHVPILYQGAWDKQLVISLAEDMSSLASHVREGVVVRPMRERFDERVGRVILKYVGEGYLTRKSSKQ